MGTDKPSGRGDVGAESNLITARPSVGDATSERNLTYHPRIIRFHFSLKNPAMNINPDGRRCFLAGLGALAASFKASPLLAGPPPTVTHPRATDGDQRHEPDWDQRLTITVGQQRGDLMGHDDKVLQAAVDYVTRFGGGTVKVLPGTYTLRNAVFLPSRIRILGSGDDSVITKIASKTARLGDDFELVRSRNDTERRERIPCR